jgi:hypothetical protein
MLASVALQEAIAAYPVRGLAMYTVLKRGWRPNMQNEQPLVNPIMCRIAILIAALGRTTLGSTKVHIHP